MSKVLKDSAPEGVGASGLPETLGFNRFKYGLNEGTYYRCGKWRVFQYDDGSVEAFHWDCPQSGYHDAAIIEPAEDERDAESCPLCYEDVPERVRQLIGFAKL